MIFSSAPGEAAPPPVTIAIVERAATSRVYEVAAEGKPPGETALKGDSGDNAEIKSEPSEPLQNFDWANPKTKRQFIELQQKALAKKASTEELRLYHSMRQDRAGDIFAERYVRDYAEVQRLKTLSQKLADIQQYIRPISF